MKLSWLNSYELRSEYGSHSFEWALGCCCGLKAYLGTLGKLSLLAFVSSLDLLNAILGMT